MGAGDSQLREQKKIWVNNEISSNLVVIFSKTTCPYCRKAKTAFQQIGFQNYTLHELDKRNDSDVIMDVLKDITGARTVPRVFINGKCIGGGSEVAALQQSGKLKPMLEQCGAL